MSLPTPSPAGTGGSRAGGDPSATAALPRTFGRYVLFDLIGTGGMAEIYLSKVRTTEAGGSRLAVVKQILPELSQNAKFAEAFVQEAKLAARLSHANVVQVFDLGRAPAGEGASNARLFIAMEYVEGLDLSELLRRCARTKTPLPVDFALLVVMEALRGLDYAHRRSDEQGHPLGIVHRDVSPSNLLVSVDGEVKLCDFGIARANDLAGGRVGDAVSAEAIQGKAGYMSPEHARGEPLDARGDVFAVGVILWELLAGRRLYRANKADGESLLDVARRAEIGALPERGLANEQELHDIVAKALCIDPNGRFPSAAAMLDALQRYVSSARLVASPIRLGEWLTTHFGAELVEARRARERAVRAIEAGPIAVVTPLAPPSAPTAPNGSPARVDSQSDPFAGGSSTPMSPADEDTKAPPTVASSLGSTGKSPAPATASNAGSQLPSPVAHPSPPLRPAPDAAHAAQLVKTKAQTVSYGFILLAIAIVAVIAIVLLLGRSS